MQRFKAPLFRPFHLGLVLCLTTAVPACGGKDKPEDTEEEDDTEDDKSKDKDTSSKEDESSSDESSSSSTTGDTSSDTSDTSSSETDTDTTPQDPGPQLGKCDRALPATKTVSADISASETWSGVVKLTGEIELRDGVTLTIEKGTTILADANAKLVVGDTLDDSTINAVGTKDEPIRFCGSTDSPGSWQGVELGKETQAASVLSFVSIENAGADEEPALKVLAPVRLDTVEISSCAGHGLLAVDFAAESKGLRIEKCQFAARLDQPNAVHNFPKESFFVENTTNALELGFDRIDSTVVFRDLGAPYRQLRNLDLRDKAKVKFEAGVEYEIGSGREFVVGGFSDGAEFISAGTETDKVEIRGMEAKAGAWSMISVKSTSAASTSLTHTVIRHGGEGDRPCLRVDKAIKLDHVSIEDALGGAYIRDEGLAAQSTHFSAKNVKGKALEIDAEALVGLPADGTFEGNESQAIWVNAGEIKKSGTIVKMPVPYRISGLVRLGGGVDLVVAPGVHFEMEKREGFELDPLASTASSVILKGTDNEKIKFTGATKQQGFWGAVRLGKDLKSTSVVENVEFSDGGNGFQAGMLELERAFPVTKCVFSNSGGYGIKRDRDDATDYTKDNQFQNNKDGDVGT